MNIFRNTQKNFQDDYVKLTIGKYITVILIIFTTGLIDLPSENGIRCD